MSVSISLHMYSTVPVSITTFSMEDDVSMTSWTQFAICSTRVFPSTFPSMLFFDLPQNLRRYDDAISESLHQAIRIFSLLLLVVWTDGS